MFGFVAQVYFWLKLGGILRVSGDGDKRGDVVKGQRRWCNKSDCSICSRSCELGLRRRLRRRSGSERELHRRESAVALEIGAVVGRS